MKKAIIITGGTLCCKRNKNGLLVPDFDFTKSYLNQIADFETDEYDFFSPYLLLSENLDGAYLNKLIEFVKSLYKKGYKKFIITHGTDTLPFTGAALSFAMIGFDLTAVIVSCCVPPCDDITEAESVITAAANFLSGDLKGVFASYKNGEDVFAKIYRASRIMLFPQGSGRLETLGGGVKNIGTGTDYVYPLHSNVLAVNIMPGLTYNYDLSLVKSVLLLPYHSGTVDIENPSLLNFLKNCKKNNIPAVLPLYNNKISYSGQDEFEQFGIICVKNIALPALYMKLWLAGGKSDEIIKFIKTPLSDEFALN